MLESAPLACARGALPVAPALFLALPARSVPARAAMRGGMPDAAGRRLDDTGEPDRFCRIPRVEGPAGPLFLYSVMRGAALFHAEMAAETPERQAAFGAVGAGFAALLGWFRDVRTVPLDLHVAPAPEGFSGCAPMRRWIVGHQIFAVLTQGLVMALQDFEAAMAEGDAAVAAGGLALGADLLVASAVAFRFACDFPPELYRDVIRPRMMPPHMQEGFSGLLSADHRVLVQVLGRLQPLMAAAAAQCPMHHARLTLALQRVYDDHKFICARFGGASAPSLRGRTCSHLSGVEQLEGYRRARLRLLRPGNEDAVDDGVGPVE